MGRTERIVLWVLVGLTLAGLIVTTAVIFGELNELERQFLVLRGGDDGELPLGEDGGGVLRETPAVLPASPPGQTTQVAVAGVEVLTDSVAMTVTVRAYGAGDLLFEPPVLRSEEGQTYPVTGDSLEEARIAFLDLVTRGQATAGLTFAGRLSPTAGLWLVFNPNQEPTSVIAPPMEVPVPLRQ